MRIGELAATVGVTPRTVRHYHHEGLLPEPDRLANGYRDYTLRHAVALARIRRLTELGLGLAEVRDVLADDTGRDLVEVLEELDQDLARQETAIRDRRARLRALLDSDGPLPDDAPLSPELAALFARTAPPAGSPSAARDREMLALIDTGAAPEDRRRLLARLSAVVASPASMALTTEAYAVLDALAGADPADPRVDEAARRLAACVPRELLPDAIDVDQDNGLLRALYADVDPAQGEAFRRALRLLGERGA
ncbi:MerR family transcriptional regulator [Streptomyces sp. NPDC005840]|uniref:MerR family transcriptional regulator n=1 Tax=Streptomyces doudnae TaxID=3075536 RepID=A0ABD5EKD9_9ACTN|nr:MULTISPECIES: MerR family transcriptional regulator [unclassified Streptomyces]MDT0435101.1 MerR family transcriptional regulator [Streptomyces sp. DSM 41981]MYQ68225.1 MerR family transcriptional regulator [Streptomyces sp. SID4950]SCE44248.1 DNA-binding transcriptional regulator, MerR family [Streptomyces sp. SolWspMP-5a-2]